MSKPVRNSSGTNSNIFISYRRADTAHAGRLCADLKLYFGDDQIFMDVEGIQGGQDFVRVIEARLASAKVLLAVIGPRWLQALTERSDSQNKTDDWWPIWKLPRRSKGGSRLSRSWLVALPCRQAKTFRMN